MRGSEAFKTQIEGHLQALAAADNQQPAGHTAADEGTKEGEEAGETKCGSMMKHAALFNGISGFQLAASWMGWENVMSSEIDRFCNRVSKFHFPNCTQHYDIKTTDFTIYRGLIDVLTGGFPCQPYSMAGKRKGKEDERHLWPYMLGAIRAIQPRWVVGENVRGLVNWDGGLVFHEVQADLEAAGYEVFPFLLPAAGVNAPHERYRIWFVAYRSNQGQGNPIGNRFAQTALHGIAGYGGIGLATHAGGQRSGKSMGGQQSEQLDKNGEAGRTVTNPLNIDWRGESQGWSEASRTWRQLEGGNWDNWPTQSPVCDGDDGFPTELLRQRLRDAGDGYLTAKEINKILAKAHTQWRNESIKAGGNAIVPRLALQIFKTIAKFEEAA
jgi:DNA (cytosine-5)-methyltransferase 1